MWLYKRIHALPIKQQLQIIDGFSPLTAKAVGPALRGQTPDNPAIVLVTEAWKAAGRPLPREQYQEALKARPVTPHSHAPGRPCIHLNET